MELNVKEIEVLAQQQIMRLTKGSKPSGRVVSCRKALDGMVRWL